MNKAKKFLADRQTLEDLNMLGKHRQGSIYGIFNQTKTRGGELLMQRWFQNPLLDMEEINRRTAIFSYFQRFELRFPFDLALFNTAESYLDSGHSGNYLFGLADIGIKRMKKVFFHDGQFQQIYEGLCAAIGFLKECSTFLKATEKWADAPGKSEFDKEREVLAKIFANPRLSSLVSQRAGELSFFEICEYDFLLRQTMTRGMAALLNTVYHLDVYTAVAKVAGERNLSYGNARPAEEQVFKTSALWHPGLTKAVANKLSFKHAENMLFLTGANMAGKSTLMKAFGITVYLAHMGFPVPACDLVFSISDGLVSSINVPDDLNRGYSHFYAEVLRVKKVAEDVASGKNLVVIFDELFKGTNVKDAYEGTLAVTAAFAEYRNCFFMVSTHIIEVGAGLRKQANNIQFAFLPTEMDGPVPRYTYQLEPGITSDRQGMMIIQNEGIIDLITGQTTEGFKQLI